MLYYTILYFTILGGAAGPLQQQAHPPVALGEGQMGSALITITVILIIIIIIIIVVVVIILVLMIVLVIMIIIMIIITIIMIIVIIIVIVNVLVKINGVSTNAVAANFMFFDRGTFWVLPFTYFCLPKSARACLFPQSVRIVDFCSGPVSVHPICPQPNTLYTASCLQAARKHLLHNNMI